MNSSLLGLATTPPPHSMAQDDLAGHVNRISYQRSDSQKRLLKTLFRSTEIESRGSVLLESPGENAPVDNPLKFYREAGNAEDCGPTTRERMERYSREAGALALDAARKALADAGIPGAKITHIVTVSCTGFYSPGIDIFLMKALELSPETARLNVGFMGCHGAINGLRAAHAIASSDPNAIVLLCAVELCTLHFQYGWNRDRMVANSLFADGAAALVIAAQTEGRDAFWNVRSTGSFLFANSEDAMSWNIGDHGFEMTLSSRVPDLIGGDLAPWLSRWLGAQGLKIEDVHSWAIHPGGPRILTAVAETLKLTEADLAASRHILARHGNMSSPTVVFILEHLCKMKAAKPCVMLGFGPGLVAEVALLEAENSSVSPILEVEQTCHWQTAPCLLWWGWLICRGGRKATRNPTPSAHHSEKARFHKDSTDPTESQLIPHPHPIS